MLLREIEILEPMAQDAPDYPFSVPIVRELKKLCLQRPVTILVGENGCGKSTLLEATAMAAGSFAVGGQSLDRDPSLAHVRKLTKYLRLSWTKRTHKGFFLRSEDFFNFARKVREDQIELQKMAEEFSTNLTGYGRMLAVGSAQGQRRALESRYGEDLDANSHGESFLKLFQSRLAPSGLYILDEPEAPLSPVRQIALIAMIRQCVNQGSQFLIATHSPILMGYPDAEILQIRGTSIASVLFEDLEHVQITRSFLNNPDLFLRHL